MATGIDDHRRHEDDDLEEEELDPRVQQELEKLNACTEEINLLETQLEDANCLFRTLLSDSTQQLKALSKKLGSCIEKARPYYEALEIAQKAQKECQSAATHYQRASGIHAAAKETIALAEQRFLTNSKHWEFDNAWQEMLNHATMKVMDAEKQKTDSEAEHLRRADDFQAAETEVQKLEKRLKGHISKTRPYFEQKDVFNKALESQKLRVHDLQQKVLAVKGTYARSLRNLEQISESIHAARKFKMRLPQPTREPGVGAELKSLSYDLDDLASLRSSDTATSSSSTRALSRHQMDDDSDLSRRMNLTGASSAASVDDNEEHEELDQFQGEEGAQEDVHDGATAAAAATFAPAAGRKLPPMIATRSVSVPSSLVPKSLTPVTSALEKFLLREDDEEEGKCDHEGDSSSGRPSNSLYIPKSASAEAALSGKRKEEREESPTKDNLPESGLEKY